MRKILSFVFVAISLTMSAQDFVISTSNNSIVDRLSVKELSKLEHKNADGKSTIEIEMINGAKYKTAPTKVNSMDIYDIDNAFKLGRLSKLRKYSRNTSISSFSCGDLVGVFNEEDYSNEEFAPAAYSSPMMSSFGTYFQTGVTLNTSALALRNRVSASNIRFHVADIVYVSKDVDGENIAVSARLIYPYIVNSTRSLTISTLYLDNHFTFFDEASAPSAAFGTSCGLMGMASRGYLVVQPDLIGFGASASRTQQYVDQCVNPAIVTDCLSAALQFAEISSFDENVPTINMSSSPKLINTGASQGASTALGVQYYMENKLTSTEKAALPTLSETRICAGAYNMVGNLEYFCSTDMLLYSPIFPLMMQGAVVAHPDIMKYKDGTPMRVHDFFTPELENFTMRQMSDSLNTLWGGSWFDLPAMFDVPGNYTIWNILESKSQGSSFLTYTLPMLYGGYTPDWNPFVFVHRLLAPGMVKEVEPMKYELNKDDERVQALLKVLDMSNLSDTEKWVPKAEIEMTHANDDTWVPYFNSEGFYNNMKGKGADVSLTTLENSAQIGNHGLICYVWILSEIYRISPKVTLELIRELMFNNTQKPVEPQE